LALSTDVNIAGTTNLYVFGNQYMCNSSHCEHEHLEGKGLQGSLILKIIFHGVNCCPVRAQEMQQYRVTLMLKIALNTTGVGDVK
jgi:hypothetical protein